MKLVKEIEIPLIEIYQQDKEKKLDELDKRFDSLKKEITDALTKDELEVIENFFVMNQMETEEIKVLANDLLASLIDPKQNSFQVYEKFFKKVEKLERQEELLEEQFDIRKETVVKVNSEKDQIKANVQNLQTEASKLASLESNLSLMSKILDEKLSFQEQINNVENIFLKQQKLILALLTFSIFQRLGQKGKGNLSKLALSYLIAKSLQDLLLPTDEKMESVSETFKKEINDLLEDTKGLQEKLVKNLKQIEDLEQKVEDEYKEYLELQEFQNLLYMIKKLTTYLKEKETSVKKTTRKLEDMNQKSIIKTKGK